jgi:hypothetical protein
VWIQIESYAALGNTEARIRAYTPQFDNVNGFNAGGFYAITLGPYVRAEAQRVLAELLAAGRIPSDSFIQPRQAYTSQFFPIGEDRLDGALAAGANAAAEAQAQAEAQAEAAEADAAAAAQAEAEAAEAAAAAEAEAEAAAAQAEAEAAAAAAAAEAEAARPQKPPKRRPRPLRRQRPKRKPQPQPQQQKPRPLPPPWPSRRPKPPPQPRPRQPPEVTVIQEETPAEARQSEAQLTREERDALQIAMQYFGFYPAASTAPSAPARATR